MKGDVPKALAAQARTIDEVPEQVLDALDRDMNTPVALAVLGDLAKAANEVSIQHAKAKKDAKLRAGAAALAERAVASFAKACAPLGLMQAEPPAFAARTQARRLRIRGLDTKAIDARVLERSQARAQKDFARGDAIRNELIAMGVELLDGTGTTSWKVLL